MKKVNNTIKTKKYKVKDIYINVAEIGEGKPLIFIHGWASSWQGWGLLAKELAPHYKIYMLDLPGFGDSDQLPRYSLDIISEYVSTFIDSYVPKPKAIIGASAGTFLAVHLAGINSYDNSTAVILIGTILNRGKLKNITEIYSKVLKATSSSKLVYKTAELIIKHPYSTYFLEKYIHAYKFNKEIIDVYNMPGRKKANGKSVIQLGASVMGYLMDEKLRTINKNTLLIFGSYDRYTSVKKTNDLLKSAKNPRLSVKLVPKSGHSPAYEQPRETARLVQEYLSSLD